MKIQTSCFKMGCTSSKDTDMTIMYNLSPKGDNKVRPLDDTDESHKKKEIKGDITMYSEAKLQRQLRLVERQKRRENLAKEMSDKVMDDKERLSLSTARSRGTSRATSPFASCKGKPGNTGECSSHNTSNNSSGTGSPNGQSHCNGDVTSTNKPVNNTDNEAREAWAADNSRPNSEQNKTKG